MNEKDIKDIIATSLGIKKGLEESYVTQSKKYELNTELLSQKSKAATQELFEKYSEQLNRISAELDVASRVDANSNNSALRSLTMDETYNLNGSYLHALHFDNISDVNSIVMLDSLSYLRIERDFGAFDDWQEDFIGCALSSRGGWALMVYSIPLKRYMNVVVDNHMTGIPVASIPIICLSVGENSYFRDYLADRKTYIYAMMKEFNWDVIERRIKKAEKIAKVMGK
jgi:Fe-Mn family superoxide dismutase